MRFAKHSVLLILALALAAAPTAALAQRASNAGPLELSVNYGNMWGGHIDAGTYGTFRVDTADSWYIAADLPIRYGMWGEFSYTHQGTRLNLDRRTGLTNLTDMNVDYWQLGVVQGVPKGKIVPFVMASLGLTHYSPDQDSIEIDGESYRVGSATKFSVVFGGGFKTDMGPNSRVGLRAQIRVMPTIYSASGGLWFGTGGGGVSIYGSAIWQYEVSGGVVIKLGR